MTQSCSHAFGLLHDIISIIYWHLISDFSPTVYLLASQREREVMKDERTHYNAIDLWSCVSILHCKKKLSLSSHHSSRSYGKQAGRFLCRFVGRLTDKLQIDFKVFNILYRLNYLDFICDCLSENLPSLHLLVFWETPF